MIKHYVVGFAFDHYERKVVLLRKRRPEWQEGLLNGVGGRVEENESPKNAMIREFKEETGVHIQDWTLFCTLVFEDSKTWYFHTLSDKVYDCKTVTDEEVRIIPVNDIHMLKMIPNLVWLIPLALDNAVPKPLYNAAHPGLKNKYVEGI